MPPAEKPRNEAQRLHALLECNVLDTPSEAAFDDLTQLAARLCGTPIALVSLVDCERQWFKSAWGLEARETHRDLAFCGYAIHNVDPLIIGDAATDERTRDNALVTGEPGIRFYAGVPLLTQDGFPLGTLCVIDLVPRDISPEQLTDLITLARQAASQLELRRVARRLEASKSEAERRARLAHFSRDLTRGLLQAADLPTMLRSTTERIVRETDAWFAGIWTLPPGRENLEASAISWAEDSQVSNPAIHAFDQVIRWIATKRCNLFSNDVQRDPRLGPHWDAFQRPRSFAAFPLMIGDQVIGVLAVFARVEFDGQMRESLDTVAGGLASSVDRKWAEESVRTHVAKLAVANAELRNRNRELDEFTYIASHDLQEPIRKLVSFSDLLRIDLGDQLSEQAEQDLRFITEAARRMQTLVTDLLALCRSGRSAMKLENVALGACVEAVCHALASRIEETGAEIRTGDLPTVVGDATLLTQLYQNLIGNGIKYAHSERKPVVELTADRDDEGWVLGVRDNGIGIKPEYREQVFQPFKRLHGRGTYEGSGIGLAICRKAVERHGGTLWLESEPDAGCHFQFTLKVTPNAGEGQSAVECLQA